MTDTAPTPIPDLFSVAGAACFMGAEGYIQAHNKNAAVLPLVVNSGESGTLDDALYYSWFAVNKGDEEEYADGDGYCPIGRDVDGDHACTGAGERVRGGDCDDGNADVSPDAHEDCFNHRDDDCDGRVDLRDPDCFVYFDRDADGFCGMIAATCVAAREVGPSSSASAVTLASVGYPFPSVSSTAPTSAPGLATELVVSRDGGGATFRASRLEPVEQP